MKSILIKQGQNISDTYKKRQTETESDDTKKIFKIILPHTEQNCLTKRKILTTDQTNCSLKAENIHPKILKLAIIFSIFYPET